MRLVTYSHQQEETTMMYMNVQNLAAVELFCQLMEDDVTSNIIIKVCANPVNMVAENPTFLTPHSNRMKEPVNGTRTGK